MLTTLTIDKFKAIEHENFELKPLTIFTGLNSTGKSTCLQAVLAFLYYSKPNANKLLEKFDLNFSSLRNKNMNAKEISVTMSGDYGELKLTMYNAGSLAEYKRDFDRDLENGIYYLNANRNAYEDFEIINGDYKCGTDGKYLIGTFNEEKSNPVIEALQIVPESQTLSSHVNYWLSYILNLPISVDTEKVKDTYVKTIYTSDGLPNLSPRHLGVGVSYLAKVLVLCLRANWGDLIMIENPEIHLHPGAQARLGEFLAYVASAGIQLIIETHSEHLINKIQYQARICRGS